MLALYLLKDKENDGHYAHVNIRVAIALTISFNLLGSFFFILMILLVPGTTMLQFEQRFFFFFFFFFL